MTKLDWFDYLKYFQISLVSQRSLNYFQLCCPLADRLIDDKCIFGENKYPPLPNVYGYKNVRMDELFQLVIYDPCQEKHFLLPENYNDYMIFANGSLYLYYYKIFVKSTSYCLAVINEDVMFVITICSEICDEILKTINNKIKIIIADYIEMDMYKEIDTYKSGK